MAGWSVVLAPEFVEDLFEIYRYVARHDGRERARELTTKLENKARSLAHLPHRGHALPELSDLGLLELREILHGPYRILFKIIDSQVQVLACIDGRRDVESVLLRRLLTS